MRALLLLRGYKFVLLTNEGNTVAVGHAYQILAASLHREVSVTDPFAATYLSIINIEK